MKRIVAALAFFFLGIAASNAADVKNIDLGKQVQVWFVEDHTLPMVSFTVSLPAGSASDPADRPGLAAFAASMLDEGAGNLDSAAFHQALANKAIQFSAEVERDYTVITIQTLSENAPEAMHLLQMALTQPRFDNEVVARMRAQIIQSLQQEDAQPPQVAANFFMRAFFNGHPYGHPRDGEIQGVAAVTPNDLRGFIRAHWVKDGVRIALAGDISQQAAAKLLGQTFAPLPSHAVPLAPNVGKLGSPGVHVLAMPVPQPTAVFGLPGIMRSDPDFIPGYVDNYILGGGSFSSRLMTEVREKRGLTYGISTSLTAYRKASVIVGSVASRADAIGQTLQVVKRTLADFAAEGPTQAELDDAKTYLTGSFPLAFASNAGISAQLGVFQRQDLDIGYIARRNALIQAVTLADVKRVAKRFDPARLTVVVAGSASGSGAPQSPQPPVRPTPQPAAPLPQASGQPQPAKPAPKPVDKPVIKTPVKPSP